MTYHYIHSLLSTKQQIQRNICTINTSKLACYCIICFCFCVMINDQMKMKIMDFLNEFSTLYTLFTPLELTIIKDVTRWTQTVNISLNNGTIFIIIIQSATISSYNTYDEAGGFSVSALHHSIPCTLTVTSRSNFKILINGVCKIPTKVSQRQNFIVS